MWNKVVFLAVQVATLSLTVLCQKYCSLYCATEDCDITSQIDCECNTYILDMINNGTTECKPKPKSKHTAWYLSYFLGWAGADRFYLGTDLRLALLKMCTAGGFGIWYWMDLLSIWNDEVQDGNGYDLIREFSVKPPINLIEGITTCIDAKN